MAELTPYQRDVLIRTALGEARGQGVEGMADVIQTVFNRANSGRYPSDPAAVALQPSQYSTWNAGEGGNNPQQFSPNSRIYQTAAQALDAVVAGRPDPTGGALFYHTPGVNPSWATSVNTNGTIRRNGHIFYPSHPVPPGEIPSVATFLDTVRMPPQPATIAPNLASLRSVTSPSGGNGELQQALNRIATTKANAVTPQMRRPQLPAMGTPDVGALYAGIYDQPERAASASDRARGKAPKPSAARPLPVKQSAIERGPSRTALANLTSPGAIDASVRGASASTDQALAAALTRRVASLPPPVPQSPIDRGATRVATSPPAAKPRVTVSTPYTTPQSPIERSAARPVTQSPIGQPPATRVVQSVPMPPVPAARQAIPQSFAGMEGGAPRVAAVEERLPSTPMAGRLASPPPVVFDPSFSTAEVTGNVGQTVHPNGPLAPIPRQTIARVPVPLPPYNAVATDLDVRAMPALPRPRPNLGMGGVDIPAVISQTGQVAPTPMPRLQRGGIFGKPQIFGHDVPLPGLLGVLQGATMAMNNASGPFNNGADNVLYNGLRGGDLNTPGAATHQAGGYLYAPKAGGGFINVGRVNPSMSAAALYDSRNAGNGGPRTAADRAGKSLSQSGGARSIME